MRNQNHIFYSLKTDVEAFYKKSTSTLPNYYHHHNNDSYEIFLFLKGNLNFHIEQSCYHLNRGDLFIMRPDELHRAINLDNSVYERVTVNIRTTLVDKLSSPKTCLTDCFYNRPFGKDNLKQLNEQEISNIILLAHKLNEAVCSEGYGSDVLIGAYLTELLVQVNLIYQNKADSNVRNFMPPLIVDVMKYIEEHLTETITLKALSAHCFHNGAYISRKFKEVTGITIQQYINNKRITLARNYLSDGKSLIEACHLSGFHDYSNFYRAFTKQVGCAPNKYRKQT